MVVAEKQTDQWNRIERPAVNPHIYGQIISDKGAKTYNRERKTSSISDGGKISKTTCKNHETNMDTLN